MQAQKTFLKISQFTLKLLKIFDPPVFDFTALNHHLAKQVKSNLERGLAAKRKIILTKGYERNDFGKFSIRNFFEKLFFFPFSQEHDER